MKFIAVAASEHSHMTLKEDSLSELSSLG